MVQGGAVAAGAEAETVACHRFLGHLRRPTLSQPVRQVQLWARPSRSPARAAANRVEYLRCADLLNRPWVPPSPGEHNVNRFQSVMVTRSFTCVLLFRSEPAMRFSA